MTRPTATERDRRTFSPTACPRCKRMFKTNAAMGVHMSHVRQGPPARRERLCPDKRIAEEVRDIQLRFLRLKTKLKGLR